MLFAEWYLTDSVIRSWNVAYLWIVLHTMGAESEPKSESHGVVATSQELESESESIKLPWLWLQNFCLNLWYILPPCPVQYSSPLYL